MVHVSIRSPHHIPGPAPLLTVMLALLLWAGCAADSDPFSPEPTPLSDLTLLALGDSYTVGQALPQELSWPFQLADSLATAGDTLRTLDVLAQTGWTTRDLLDALRSSLAGASPERPAYGLVTLMIGVNNQFQQVDLQVFAAEMDTLIEISLGLAGNDPHRVLGFSIPDYGVTPVGQMFNAETIATEVQEHNAVLQAKYDAAGILMLDVTELSLAAASDPSLISRDGLHYSPQMYRLWVQMMLPEIRHRLGLDPASASAR